MQTDARPCVFNTWQLRLGMLFAFPAFVLFPTLGRCDVEKQQPKKRDVVKFETSKPHQVEAVFVDGSKMKLDWLDDLIVFQTPYGNLSIPVADIKKIEFGFRLTKQDDERLQKAVKDLGSTDFRTRAAATNDLLKLGAKAYPTLVQLAKENNPEVAKRVAKALEKITKDIPEKDLNRSVDDVLYTGNSKITGRLITSRFLTKTFQFGLQKMEVAHLARITVPSKAQDAAVIVLPDPGNLRAFQQHIGKTLTFRVTGAPPKTAGAWGTTVYTLDSRLGVAAVHAGVLKPGQTGNVKLIVLGPQPAFQGSTQNGIVSSPYGAYPGYQILPR